MSDCPRDVIVLGCGVSGLTAARLFAGQGLSVTVLDEYPEPGGNHISRDFGPFTVDIGSILFWEGTDFPKVFPEATAEWHPAHYGIDRVTPAGAVMRYPIDLKREVLSRSPVYVARVLSEIAWQRIAARPNGSVPSFLRYYLGDTLLRDSGLSNYVSRFYGLPIDQVAFDLAGKRMNWVAENGSIRKRAARGVQRLKAKLHRKKAGPPLTAFVRPRSGFGAMYRPIVEALGQSGVEFHLGSPIEEITRDEDGFQVRVEGRTFRAARLVSTIPLARIAGLVGIDAAMLPESIPLATLCVRFRGRRGFDAPILYNFHKRGAWKRLTVHSDWYGQADGEEYMGVEVPLVDPSWTLERCFEDFREMTRSLGLFDGELACAGGFRTEFAYPLYDQAAAAKSKAVLARLHGMGIETAGRQGNFDYIPAASQATIKVRWQFGAQPAKS